MLKADLGRSGAAHRETLDAAASARWDRLISLVHVRDQVLDEHRLDRRRAIRRVHKTADTPSVHSDDDHGRRLALGTHRALPRLRLYYGLVRLPYRHTSALPLQLGEGFV